VYSHVEIREEGKENAFSIGKTLIIGSEEFEDLDEIIGEYLLSRYRISEGTAVLLRPTILSMA